MGPRVTLKLDIALPECSQTLGGGLPADPVRKKERTETILVYLLPLSQTAYSSPVGS